MRRPATLEVDTTATTATTTQKYELTQSPSSSTVNIPPTPEPPRLAPSIRLLFSLLSTRDLLFLVFPAVIFSVVAGGIAPFMTYVIGQSFNAFAAFPLTPNPPQSAKDALLHGVGIAALELVGLAFGALALSSITSSLWIWTGERNIMALRKQVYEAVTEKDMVWFDTKMGADGNAPTTEGEQGPQGAGALMAKFARETDDVRMASSLASGMLLQYLTTCIACLILAFTRSWSLTLVILSAVPLLVFIQALSQSLATPLLASERAHTAAAATRTDRAIAAIATVKAFTAQLYERSALAHILTQISGAARRLAVVWGLTSALAQFTMMAMFVQGFWFGARLVRKGEVNAGDVMSVFWACLIATSNLQMCIPQLIVLAKGKFAVAELLALTDRAKTRRMQGITPTRCEGEMALHDVTFAYPARPDVPVLQNVSIYLPAHETTFVVGSSGSGKSTVAALLLRMYAPQSGSVRLDEQEVSVLEDGWVKTHVAGVGQGAGSAGGGALVDASVHDNVAMALAGAPGRRPEDVTREEVEAACRAALLHDFVRDLPEGYDTKLGNGGANLSGGQRQRLAIARARLRNPSVLVLDEATSALDSTSRGLVFDAVRRWRKGKTTIVITHDLSQIEQDDFVYVMKDGQVVEQGFRYDLEAPSESGEFSAMMGAQGLTQHDDLITEDDDSIETEERGAEEEGYDAVEAILSMHNDTEESLSKHKSLAASVLRPITFGNWMFDVVHDLTAHPTPAPAVVSAHPPDRISRFVPPEAFAGELERPRRPSSFHAPSFPPPPATHTVTARRLSLQFTPTSPTFSLSSPSSAAGSMAHLLVKDDEDFDVEKAAMQRSGTLASRRRLHDAKPRARWDGARLAPLTTIAIEKPSESIPEPSQDRPQTFIQLIRDIYPTVPHKAYVLLGLCVCVMSGAMTPIFSFLLSRLLFEVSIGARDVSTINRYGGIVLGVAAVDGLLMGLKFFIMETAAMSWLTRVRDTSFARVLAQDKKWFDKSTNSPVRLVQILIKDGDDARTLLASVLGQCAVVVAMLSVGLIWALARGWQLTLVGFAIAPVFAVTMAVQTNLAANCELRNKRAREEVAKAYYEAISNIRSIRSMAFESVFRDQFNRATDKALSTGVRGAFVEGCTYGVASALIYLAEALLFYVGAVLIARGTYTYLQMVQVLNLVVFTVTIGSQLMAFTQKFAKSVQATRDFNELLQLSTKTDESRGVLRPPIVGDVAFNHVSFAYPERPDTQVLKDVTLRLTDGECVAIVGSSGSGKSTVASLLQRLYEPDFGTISVGLNELRATEVDHLRAHVAVVSQNPNLFDATIAENISYGSKSISDIDVRRAAKAANVHEFVMSLPQGYDTMVGENASLISGGQAQRLQIARALARPSRILILDECTSALDPANQAAVLETVCSAKVGRTTVMVTHKLPVMRMCDRILVMHEGTIAEEGTYEELMARNGVFATLANGGEWLGE